MTKTFDATSTTDEVLDGVRLDGKRVLVTGVSAGLGVETARVLAAHGADVVGTVRNLDKGKTATAEIDQDRLTLIEMDLASLTSVRKATDQLNADGRQFDLVIANAGVMAPPLGHTVDGFETQFGTNHLGHFVFVNRIFPLFKAGSRLVNLSSSGHRYSDVNLEDPNFEHTHYEPFLGYGRSKTANILFAVEFDRRHRDAGVRATAVHPGGIQTELSRHLEPGSLDGMLKGINEKLAAQGKPAYQFKTVPQGAATSVWAGVVALADEVAAHFCEDCHVSQIVPMDREIGIAEGGVRAYALDPERAKALWAKSEEMVGERFPAAN